MSNRRRMSKGRVIDLNGSITDIKKITNPDDPKKIESKPKKKLIKRSTTERVSITTEQKTSSVNKDNSKKSNSKKKEVTDDEGNITLESGDKE